MHTMNSTFSSNPWDQQQHGPLSDDNNNNNTVNNPNDAAAVAISNYLASAVQRGAVRRNSLDAARRQIMGNGIPSSAHAYSHSFSSTNAPAARNLLPPPSLTIATASRRPTALASGAGCREEDIVYEALLAAGMGVRPNLPSMLNPSRVTQEDQHSTSSSSSSSTSSSSTERAVKKKDMKNKKHPLVIPSSTTELLQQHATSSSTTAEDELSPSMENVQLHGIKDIHPHDVLCGRGGSVNHHPGNEMFRRLVQSQKVVYCKSTKGGKLKISEAIVKAIRNQNPPGRFLHHEQNASERGGHTWYDIGDIKARDKTSQALREGAPRIREKLNRMSPLSSSSSRLPHHSTAPPPTQNQVQPQLNGSFLPSSNPFLAQRLCHAPTMSRPSIAPNHGTMVAPASFGSSSHQHHHLQQPETSIMMRQEDDCNYDYDETTTMDVLSGSLRSNSSHMAALRALAAANNRHRPKLDAKTTTVIPHPVSMHSNEEVAKIISAAQAAAANAASMPREQRQLVGGRRRPPIQPSHILVAGSEPRASSMMHNIPADHHRDWEAARRHAAPDGATVLPELGRCDGGRSEFLMSQQRHLQKQRTTRGGGDFGHPTAAVQAQQDHRPTNAMVSEANQQPKSRPLPRRMKNSRTNGRLNDATATTADSAVPSLPVDLVHRLILAETFAQRTANGTMTDAMRAEEKRMGIYLDAGLSGVNLDAMVAAKDARTEESIVSNAYNSRNSNKRRKQQQEEQEPIKDDEHIVDGTSTTWSCSGPPKKRLKLLGKKSKTKATSKTKSTAVAFDSSRANTGDDSIQDALVAIGAMITLKSSSSSSQEAGGGGDD